MNTQTDKVVGRHKHIKEMKHNNRKKNRTHRSFDVMRPYEALIKKIYPGTHLNSTLSLFYKELSKNKEWFFFFKKRNSLEDGTCAKDEEREPLHPDGNNKDVKVTAAS